MTQARALVSTQRAALVYTDLGSGPRAALRAALSSQQHVRDLMVAEARRVPLDSERLLLTPDGQP